MLSFPDALPFDFLTRSIWIQAHYPLVTCIHIERMVRLFG